MMKLFSLILLSIKSQKAVLRLQNEVYNAKGSEWGVVRRDV